MRWAEFFWLLQNPQYVICDRILTHLISSQQAETVRNPSRNRDQREHPRRTNSSLDRLLDEKSIQSEFPAVSP